MPHFLLIFVLYAWHILFDLRFIFFSHSVMLRWCYLLLSLLSTSRVTHPTPCTYYACFSPLFFVVVIMLISPDVYLTLFVTFITTCKTSSIKIWLVLPAGLAENLTQVVFRQPFVIQHVRTQLLSCEMWNFFYFSSLYIVYNQLVIFDVIVFPLAASCYFVTWVTKMHD